MLLNNDNVYFCSFYQYHTNRNYIINYINSDIIYSYYIKYVNSQLSY